MVDLLLEIGRDGADLVIEGGDLKRDEGLATPTVVSIFSDARAEDSELPPLETNPRGWWATEADDPFGSKLWLAYRGKITDANLELVRSSIVEALQWVVNDGIAEGVEVSVERGGPQDGRVDLGVELVRGNAQNGEDLWAALEASSFDVPGLRLRVLPL